MRNLLSAMLVIAPQSALEDTEIASTVLIVTSPRAYSRARCITVYEPQFFADAAIQVAFVGMQARLTMHVPADDIGDRLCIGRGNME